MPDSFGVGRFFWPGFANGDFGLSGCPINGFLEERRQGTPVPSQQHCCCDAFEFYTTWWYVFGRDANVTKAVQDKTFCNAGCEGMDR
jgi:hypothetical protein